MRGDLLDATSADRRLVLGGAAAARALTPDPASPASSLRRTAPWLTRSTDGYAWHFRDDHASLADELSAGQWNDLAANSAASLIKENDGRQVWHIARPGGDVYAKVYVADDWSARLKRVIRGPSCLREWRVADYAREHGLPTVQPIACAYRPSRWAGARCLLLTAALRNAVPLNRCWTGLLATPDSPQRHRRIDVLTTQLAELIALAHQCGFRHVDLHAGNLLVVDDPAAPDAPRIVFVDLHDVCIGRSVSDDAVLCNLAQLNQWFRRHAGLTQRIRFLRRYVRARETFASRSPMARPLGLGFKDLVAALDRRAADHARRLYAKRDRRALRTSKYFARVRLTGGWKGHVFLSAKHAVPGSRASRTTFTRRQWEQWLADPLAWVHPDEAWQRIKDSHSATVCRRTLPAAPESISVVCKRSLARNGWRRFAQLFRESRNRRTWRLGYALVNRDLPTARPLAVLERRRAGLLLDSLVITEELPDAHDLDALLAMDLTRLDSCAQRRAKDRLLDALHDLVRRMHARGFAHRDLKASNVMIQWDPAFATPPRLSLVDLDGLVLKRRATDDDLRRAIARLNVSLDHCVAVTRTDRLRFIKRMLSGWGQDPANWKSLWHDLAARSHTKRRQHEAHRAWKLRHYGRE